MIKNDANKSLQENMFLKFSQSVKTKGVNSDNETKINSVSTLQDKEVSIWNQENQTTTDITDNPNNEEANNYFNEDKDGEVSFDVSGFYNDACGLSLNNNQNKTDDITSSGSDKSNGKDKFSEVQEAKEHLKTLIKNNESQSKINEAISELASLGVSDKDIKKTEKEGQQEKVDTNENDNKNISATKENVMKITAGTISFEQEDDDERGNIGTDFLNKNPESTGLSDGVSKQLQEHNNQINSSKSKIKTAKSKLDDAAKKYSEAETDEQKSAANNEVNNYKKEIEAEQKKEKEAEAKKEQLLKENGIDDDNKNVDEKKKANNEKKISAASN